MSSRLREEDYNVEVFISEQARDRLRKDKTVKDKKKKYIQQIGLIAAAPLTWQRERIGKFLVSPQGYGGPGVIRIAWHFEMDEGNIEIYIDDLLYHKKNSDYVDRWNHRAREGTITLNDYSGFQPQKDTKLAA